MKNDYSFKFVAVIIIAGVIVALMSPVHPVQPTNHAAVDSTPVAHATE